MTGKSVLDEIQLISNRAIKAAEAYRVPVCVTAAGFIGRAGRVTPSLCRRISKTRLNLEALKPGVEHVRRGA